MLSQLIFPIEKPTWEPINKPFNSEKDFTTRLGRQIHQAWWFWHKMSDMDISLKPADSLFALNWVYWICEIKVWNEKNKVDVFKKLRPNQAFGLRRWKKNWWLSVVIYYSKLYNKYRVMEFEEEMILLLSE